MSMLMIQTSRLARSMPMSLGKHDQRARNIPSIPRDIPIPAHMSIPTEWWT